MGETHRFQSIHTFLDLTEYIPLHLFIPSIDERRDHVVEGGTGRTRADVDAMVLRGGVSRGTDRADTFQDDGESFVVKREFAGCQGFVSWSFLVRADIRIHNRNWDQSIR